MNRKLIKDLMDAIKASDRKKTSGYDTSAVVRRIEDGTAWVHIPGGVDETPVKLTINASVGDTVQVRVSGGRAFLVGNRTAPPTDDTTAIKATYVAKNAQETAVEAKSEASEAWHYAGTAKEAAESAQDSADSAAEAAIEAWNHADDAHQAAVSANNSANNALVQLSVVEDVAGTLRWISEHGSFVPTTDTEVIAGSVYFIYQNGDYVPIANPDPSANPSDEGWYVLDVTESQAKYIMAHLAVTSAGLWVLPVDQMAEHPLVDSDGDQIIDSDDNPIVDFSEDPQHASGYKVLLSGGTNDPNFPIGLSIYNDEGALVANYGTTITIGAEMGKHVYIDTDSVDIKDGENTLASFNGYGVNLYDEEGEIAKFLRTTDSSGSSGSLELKRVHTLGYERVSELTGSSLSFSVNDTVHDTSFEGVSYDYWGVNHPVQGRQGDRPTVEFPFVKNTESGVINTGTWVNIAIIYVIGTVVANFGCAFEANGAGTRAVTLTNSSNAPTGMSRYDAQTAGNSGFQTRLNITRILSSETMKAYYVWAYQGSGDPLYIYPFADAVIVGHYYP